MGDCNKCCELNTVPLKYGLLQVLPWNNDATIEKLILLRILSYIFQKLHQEVILALKIDRLEPSKHLLTHFQQQQHYKKV